uniref:Ataxin 7 like 2 n=2 Tax=Cercopithecidae TaxID=9527 RepID=A0A2K6BZY6_MACNE
MAVRERAAAAMAALERRVPSLDDFAGQSWSSWVERADLPATDETEVQGQPLPKAPLRRGGTCIADQGDFEDAQGPKTAVFLLCDHPISAGPEKLGVTLTMLW